MKGNKRNKLLYILGTIIVSVITITVAYAILSTTLNISGTSDIQSVNWDIHFDENEENILITTTGSATYTKPTITGTTIRDYNVSLTKPGDSVTFTFPIINNSDITAEVVSIVNSTPTCTSVTGNKTDEEIVCNNLKYTVETGFEVGDIISKKISETTYYCKKGEQISTSTANITITIEYDINATQVSSTEVTISNLKNELSFLQSEEICE